MTFVNQGGPQGDLSDQELDELLEKSLQGALQEAVPKAGARKVLILPPDISRFHSRGGYLSSRAFHRLRAQGFEVSLLPALGTHMALTEAELARMFPGIPKEAFLVHRWREDAVELGRLEADWVERISDGVVRFDWPVMVNRLLRDGGFSLIVSIGQVVPHEIAGIANHTKNIFVGTGGKEAIDKSHFLGAAWGMERILGRLDNPVRALFDEGFRRYGEALPPILWVLTVIGSRGPSLEAGHAVRGLYTGFGRECLEKAAALSQQVNIDLLSEPIQKAVVYLDPEEFRSTWIGNKAVYRTRLAMADGGELLILAPGLECFGEDPENDKRIRKHGYRPSRVILDRVKADPDLAENLSAAAHLIHGTPEGRFTVRYCPGPAISKAEIESVGFEWGDLSQALARYDIRRLRTGWNTLPDGERIFFIPNPALGLWAERSRFG